MLDIIFFAIIAYFIFKKLMQVLGDTKYDLDINNQTKQKFSDFSSNISSFMDKTAKKAAGQIDIASGLEAEMTEEQRKIFDEIRKYDASFIADKFVSNAKSAFKIIIESFAKGDKEVLGNLVTPEVYKNFSNQIAHRENQNHVLDLIIVAVKDVKIIDVFKKDLEVYIDVAIISEQIKSIKDKISGDLISGNISKVLVVKDNWRFVRQINSASKTWKLTEIIEADKNA